MRSVRLRLAMTCVAAALTVSALVSAVPAATPASAAAGTPLDPIYAIVSPTTSPICDTAGLATLLVPIVSGVVNEKVGLPDTVNVGDVILSALGPVYIVCGTLPGTKTARCQLDDQIAGLLPAPLDLVKPVPSVLGGLVGSIGVVLKTAGLGDVNPLAKALKCTLPHSAGATKAPLAAPAAPSATVLPSLGLTPPAPSLGLGDLALPSLDLTPALPQTQTGGNPATLAAVVKQKMPGWLQPVQLILAGLLVLLIGTGWTLSVREARRAS